MVSRNIKSMLNLARTVDFGMGGAKNVEPAVNALISNSMDNTKASKIPSETEEHTDEKNLTIPKDMEKPQPVAKDPKFPRKPDKKPKPIDQVKKLYVTKFAIEGLTLQLCEKINAAKTSNELKRLLIQMADHLRKYPESRKYLWSSTGIIATLPESKLLDKGDEIGHEVLSLAGYSAGLSAPGVRILTIDGGGMRGLVALEMLKQIEDRAQVPIHTLFDYVCGVSTGSLIGAMIFLLKIPIDECKELFLSAGCRVFKQDKMKGGLKLFTSYAYYDTDEWEKILVENLGEFNLSETSNGRSPRFSAVSCCNDDDGYLSNYLFRNYNHHPKAQPRFLGSASFLLWQCVRASTAAPGYFREQSIGRRVHQDGGLLTNNPTAIAIHECRHLWPGEKLHSVVSLGTGRNLGANVKKLTTANIYSEEHDPKSTQKNITKDSISLKTKFVQFVASATDTESVHSTLEDLLPDDTYLRLNPGLSEIVELDESRPHQLALMVQDAHDYVSQDSVQQQIDHMIARLKLSRPTIWRLPFKFPNIS